MNKTLKSILIRYTILLVIAVSGLSLIYFIFEPLTKYPVYFLFSSFYDIYITPVNIINFRSYNLSLEIIGACIAGSAYFLLIMLNLSTPNIKLKKRLNALAVALLIFLIFNIIRIFGIGLLFIHDFPSAEVIHKFLWYFGSIALVIIIWFVEVKKFGIKSIPFYSDLKSLHNYLKTK